MNRVLAGVFATAFCAGCYANDGAMNNGAHGPEPFGDISGPESVIRMVSEDLTFDIAKDETEVVAKFHFRSTKKEGNARQMLGFPDHAAAATEAEKRDPSYKQPWHNEMNMGPLEDFKTFVDGKPVESKLEYGFIEENRDGYWKKSDKSKGMLMAWHTVWVDFPADREVVVERRYRTANGGQILTDNKYVRFFNYTTATGGLWNGTIGKLSLRVNFKGKYGAGDVEWKSVQLGDNYLRSKPAKSEWQVVSPKQMKLDWSEFEPRTDKNRREIMIMMKPEAINMDDSEQGNSDTTETKN